MGPFYALFGNRLDFPMYVHMFEQSLKIEIFSVVFYKVVILVWAVHIAYLDIFLSKKKSPFILSLFKFYFKCIGFFKVHTLNYVFLNNFNLGNTWNAASLQN